MITLDAMVSTMVAQLLANAEAIRILRRFEIEPGPDPIQQVIDLAACVAKTVTQKDYRVV